MVFIRTDSSGVQASGSKASGVAGAGAPPARSLFPHYSPGSLFSPSPLIRAHPLPTATAGLPPSPLGLPSLSTPPVQPPSAPGEALGAPSTPLALDPPLSLAHLPSGPGDAPHTHLLPLAQVPCALSDPHSSHLSALSLAHLPSGPGDAYHAHLLPLAQLPCALANDQISSLPHTTWHEPPLHDPMGSVSPGCALGSFATFMPDAAPALPSWPGMDQASGRAQHSAPMCTLVAPPQGARQRKTEVGDSCPRHAAPSPWCTHCPLLDFKLSIGVMMSDDKALSLW